MSHFMKQSYNVYIVDYYSNYISTSVCLICCKCCLYCNGPNIPAVVELIRDWNLFVQLFSTEENNRGNRELVLLSLGIVNSSDVTNTRQRMWSEVCCSFVDLNFALGDWAVASVCLCVCMWVCGCPIWKCSYYWRYRYRYRETVYTLEMNNK